MAARVVRDRERCVDFDHRRGKATAVIATTSPRRRCSLRDGFLREDLEDTRIRGAYEQPHTMKLGPSCTLAAAGFQI